MIPTSIMQWLTEPDNPSLQYRTLVELSDEPLDTPKVQQVRAQIQDSPPVRHLLKLMHPDGYWLQKNPRSGRILGDGTEYGAYATTHFCLSYLAELGMDRTHPQVALAANRYLNLQQDDGDFFGHLSCLLGFNIRTFIMLGYQTDSRIKRSIDLLLSTPRPDYGYLCDMHEHKYKTRSAKSCIRGSAKVLLAFSRLPEYWQHPRILQLVDYFLTRDVLFKRTAPTEFVSKDLSQNRFPITWQTNVFEILLSLARLGYGTNPALARAWKILEDQKDANGRYCLESFPSQSPWKVGPKGHPNKWVTFFAYLPQKLKAA